ncbi:MAG: heavy metal-binding domain-containing protein [Ahrensia sp.]|nr:heavy metal-binding domain-containing protein [Ahrensia sp.]
MIVSTTNSVPNRDIAHSLGIVAGEAVLGANVFRDLFAGIRDFVGGRAGGYQKVLRDGRNLALDDMIAEAKAAGADAVIGVDIDYEAIGSNGSMLMVSVNGTAVKLR